MVSKPKKEDIDHNLYFYLFFSIVIFVLLAVLQVGIAHILKNNDEVIKLTSFQSPQKEDGLTYKRLKKNDPQQYQFKTTISSDEIEKIDSDNYEMMVHQFSAQWYKIYFNDRLIGGSGNYKHNNSNIWNEFATYTVPQDLIKAENEIKIEAYGAYEIGLLDLPLMITSANFANKIHDFFNLLFDSSYIIMIGIVLINLLLLGYIATINSNIKLEYIFYILANLFLIPAVFDYLTIYTVPFSVLTFKKVIIISNCMMVFFGSYGLYKQFENKLNLAAGSLLMIVLTYSLVVFSNLIDFVNFWGIINLVIIFNLITWLYTTVTNYKSSYTSKVIFWATIFALYDPINIIILSYFDINLGVTVNRFIIFPVAFVLVTLHHYMELDQAVTYEQARSEFMYQRAIKDNMTDAYNHQYIIDLLENKTGDYSLIMLDIDDFKEINDQYGHQTGDFVIKYVVEEIKNNIRKIDLVGRYGGDEFIIVLDSCPPENAEQIAQNIKQDIKKKHKTPQGYEIEVTVSVGVNYVEKMKDKKEILKEVDQNLYQAKEAGKDRVIAN